MKRWQSITISILALIITIVSAFTLGISLQITAIASVSFLLLFALFFGVVPKAIPRIGSAMRLFSRSRGAIRRKPDYARIRELEKILGMREEDDRDRALQQADAMIKRFEARQREKRHKT